MYKVYHVNRFVAYDSVSHLALSTTNGYMRDVQHKCWWQSRCHILFEKCFVTQYCARDNANCGNDTEVNYLEEEFSAYLSNNSEIIIDWRRWNVFNKTDDVQEVDIASNLHNFNIIPRT